MAFRLLSAVAAIALVGLIWLVFLLEFARRERAKLVERYTGLKALVADLQTKLGDVQDSLYQATTERDSLNRTRDLANQNREAMSVEIQRVNDQLNVLDSDSAFWKAKAESWELKYDQANADAIKCRETIADWVSQRTFGRKIFEHAPALPQEPKHMEPVHKQRIQARLAVQQAEQQFQKDLEAYNRRLNNPTGEPKPPEPVE